VFIKHCYDAFMSGEVSEWLLAHLRSLGVQRLYFAACVMFSASSAFALGFEVLIVADCCCADRSRKHHDAVLSTCIYDGYHIRVVHSGGPKTFCRTATLMMQRRRLLSAANYSAHCLLHWLG
jgi:hypothetical protein